MAWYINGVEWTGTVVTVGTGKTYATLAAAKAAMTGPALWLCYTGIEDETFEFGGYAYDVYVKCMEASPISVGYIDNFYFAEGQKLVIEGFSSSLSGWSFREGTGAYDAVLSKCTSSYGSDPNVFIQGETCNVTVRQCTFTGRTITGTATYLTIQKSIAASTPDGCIEDDYVTSAASGYGIGYGDDYISDEEPPPSPDRTITGTINIPMFTCAGNASDRLLTINAVNKMFTVSGSLAVVNNNRYWVGGLDTHAVGSPAYTDYYYAEFYDPGTIHWAEYSGGPGGASAPIAGQKAIFDAKSDLTGAPFTDGYLIISTAVACGVHVENDDLRLYVDPGSMSLTENLRCAGIVVMETGALNTNDYNIEVGWAQFRGTGCLLGSSIITVGQFGTASELTIYDEHVDADNAVFEFYGNGSSPSISVGYNSPYDVNVGTLNIYPGANEIDFRAIRWSVPEDRYVGPIFKNLAAYGDGSIKFTEMEGEAGWEGGGKWTADILSLVGDTPGGLNLYRWGGYFWNISVPSGTVNAVNCTISQSIADGGATFMAPVSGGNIDGGGNTGWDFVAVPEIPMFEMNGSLTNPSRWITGSLPIPMFSLSASFGVFYDITLDAVLLSSLSSSLHTGGDGNLTIDKIILSGTAFSNRIVTGSLKMKMTASGVASALCAWGTGDLKLNRMEMNGSGQATPLAVGTLKLNMKITGSASSGAVGQGDLVLNRANLSGTAYLESSATGHLTLRLKLNDIVLQSVYDCLVLNARNFAITQYDFELDGMVYFNGQYLGNNDTQILELSGTKDINDPILWNFKTGKLYLSEQGYARTSEQQKTTVRQVWLSYRPSGDLILTVDDGENEYEYEVESIKQIDDAVRVKLGKGLRSQFIQLELENIYGESIYLDHIKLFTEHTQRQR